MLVTFAVPALALIPERLPSQYLYDRYGREQGLPSDTVWVARQGTDDYLWIGTKNGLARFDGTRFTIFDKKSNPEFQSSDIRDIEVAEDGSLWFATYGGGVMHFADNTFTVMNKADGLADNVVHDIFIGPSGTVWFATGYGISRLQNGEFRSWNATDGLVDNRTFRIYEDPKGTVWVATLTNGISRFDGDEFHNYSAGSGIDSTQAHLFFDDPELGLIVTTVTGSTYRLTDSGPALHSNTALQSGLPLHSAVRDRDGSLWLGTYGKGLWRLKPGEEAQLQSLPLDSSQPGYVFALTEDNEGNVWASTMDGAVRIKDSPFLQYGQAEGLANATFVVTQSQADNALWAGTEGNGLFRIGPDGAITQITTREGLSSNNVSALLAEPDNTLWVGTFGGGLDRIASDGSIRHFTTVDGLPDKHVMGLLRDSNERLWVITDGGVSYLDDTTDGRFKQLESIPDTMPRQIMEDSSGRFFISSNSGLFVLDGEQLRHWTRKDGLGSDLVTTTYEDADGTIWIGTREAGLARLKNGDLFSFDTSHGLPQLSVLAILEDDDNNLWISGAGGLMTVSRDALNAVASGAAETFNARLFQEDDGLRSAQFLGGFQPAGWKARDGSLWFASNRGLVAVEQWSPTDTRAPTRPIIEQVRVNGRAIPLLDEPLVLPPEGQNLEVDYTVPRLGNPHDVHFHYQLEGFDREWQPAGERRTAYFTALTPGTKTLRIAASINGAGFDPTLTEQQAVLRLHRRPYWHETWWSRLAAGLAVLMAAVGIYFYAIHRATQRQRRLELLVDRRTRELQIALSRVEEISRIDGLTGIANRRYLDENMDKAWRQCAAQHAPISIIMLDIDFFKQFNDSEGHVAGDNCLRQVAETLQSGVLRDGDLVARYGGEEFLILLPGADTEAVAGVARRLHQKVRSLKIPHPDSRISPYLTVSMGNATAWPAEKGSPDELVQRADRALYEAKSGGRDQVRTDPGP
ncbi:GGDEF domain-containing protein [Kineobactrum sediminis]|uniref:diguanylate cyclase n=1 Tax=Kineobactrum sediminis TaxID=1905677 RepID=A0A2N5Y724_9GAMM|nr:diguanylate cyclase [Kineobactrum sediminis]PLW84198.1 GGDEF domain-containing protein [Kineobactrum sediminis]